MHRLVGFHGPAGSGKDTAGAFLVNQHGYVRLSFATPMYQMLEAAGFGWPLDQIDKEMMIPDIGVTWRHLAQTLGTEWGRMTIHPQLWIILATRTVKQNPDTKFVITDVRFENEAEMIRDLGGRVCHLIGRKLGTGNDAHQSEQRLAIKEGDAVIDNSGSLPTLHHAVWSAAS